jgi:hypothetical protein
MPQIVVEEIMRRASDDPSFRELLLKCPRAVLGSYVLTRQEKAALMSEEQAQLEAVGISAARAQTWTALDALS